MKLELIKIKTRIIKIRNMANVKIWATGSWRR